MSDVASADDQGLRGLTTWMTGEGRWSSAARLVVSMAFGIIAWEVLARFVLTNRLILVPFSEVIGALGREAQTGELWRHSQATLLELAISFPLAVVGGVLLGTLLASSRALQQTLDPLLTAMYSVPIIALAPLFIAWLGLGIESKVAIVVLVAIFPVIINTEVGLRSTDDIYLEAARSFNATRLQIFKTVTLPFAIPFIIGGVRVAFARALVGVIVAEFFGSFAGYGNAILSAGQSFQTARLLGYVVILGLLGMFSSIGLRNLERRLAPWREADTA